MRVLNPLYAALITAVSFPVFAESVKVKSPDGSIVVTVSDDSKFPTYQVSLDGKSVINNSRLGLVFKKQGEFSDGFKISDSERSSSDSTWQQPWGEVKDVRDNHQQLTVTFKHKKQHFDVTFKVYDDGIGFRYEVPKQAGMKGRVDITNELTEFSVANADKAQSWWIPARGWNRYEYVYENTPAFKAAHVHTPFTLKTDRGVHLSIHEAALTDYAGMTLNQRRPGTFKADLTPWSDGILVKKKAGFTTPWRTVQIGRKAVDLVNSNLILNLNEPNKLGDVSWVEPGKYVGIWWGMHLGENTWGSGEKHGATTSETKRYMDFAAKHGFDGVLVEGWNIGWDGSWYENGDVFNFAKSYDDFDIDAVAKYGKSKGVRLIGHHETSGSVTNYRNQMDKAFDLYKKHGVTQVKTGYVADGGQIKRIDEHGKVRHEWHDGQFMVNEYLHSVTEAAKRGISINTHEPVKDTGLRRTYPNWIAREGARGQEFNAWGTPPNPPEHIANLVFTRMLSGPMDFTPGIFDLGFNGIGDATVNRPQTTLAKQLALYVVLYSPIQMAADLPRNYEKRP
ncbi:MAG: glycoside hydrolase family 97 catalytic domain-containing protein, partial [Psychrobium sp.]